MAILQDPWAINPPVDVWEEYEKPALITETILEFAKDVLKKGEHTEYNELYDYLYECIEENIQLYTKEHNYDL